MNADTRRKPESRNEEFEKEWKSGDVAVVRLGTTITANTQNITTRQPATKESGTE
jgi:hypothetical protein